MIEMHPTRCRTPRLHPRAAWLAAVALIATLGAAPAHAGLMLSKVILDLGPQSAPRDDIELWNDGAERTQPEVVAKLREAAAIAREQDR